jgi:hypothetical protein
MGMTRQCPNKFFNEFLENEKIEKTDFIKMDIEGAEFFILPSIRNDLIKLNFPTLLISFHAEYLTEYFFQRAFRNKLLSKILFKICGELGANLFSKRIGQTILESLEQLNDYQFIYQAGGKEIYPGDLMNYIKKNRITNIVFTNNRS